MTSADRYPWWNVYIVKLLCQLRSSLLLSATMKPPDLACRLRRFATTFTFSLEFQISAMVDTLALTCCDVSAGMVCHWNFDDARCCQRRVAPPNKPRTVDSLNCRRTGPHHICGSSNIGKYQLFVSENPASFSFRFLFGRNTFAWLMLLPAINSISKFSWQGYV